MSDQHAIIPVTIIGPSAELRQQSRDHIARYPTLRLVAESAHFTPGAIPTAYADQRGVLLAHLHDTAEARLLLPAIRRAAPAWSILAISPPPALLHPHLAGWLATGSPVDLGAACLVIASGGWLTERLAALSAIQQPAEPDVTLLRRRAA